MYHPFGKKNKNINRKKNVQSNTRFSWYTKKVETCDFNLDMELIYKGLHVYRQKKPGDGEIVGCRRVPYQGVIAYARHCGKRCPPAFQ